MTNSKQQNLDEILKQTNKQIKSSLVLESRHLVCEKQPVTRVCSAHTSHVNRTMITHKTPSPVNMINVNYAIFHTQTFSVD